MPFDGFLFRMRNTSMQLLLLFSNHHSTLQDISLGSVSFMPI